MATLKKVYVDMVEDKDEDYYSNLAGDILVADNCARNKKNNATCYSSKHIRISQASKCKVCRK